MQAKFTEIANKILIDRDAIKKNFINCKLIIIHHLLPTHIPFFYELVNIFPISTFLAIPYSVTYNTVEKLTKKQVNVIIPNSLEELNVKIEIEIKNCLEENQKFFIIEVGGYCCKFLMENMKECNDNLIGVIEDTENGHRIYESFYKSYVPKWNTFSVARSSLKLGEDVLTGDSIVYSVEKIIRTLNNTLVTKKVLVLGYGKIGKSVSSSLKGRKCNVYVYDTNPIRQIEAFSNGFVIDTIENLLPQVEIVIGVTGFTSIGEEEFKLIKEKSFLFSGSSKQIEFDLKYIELNSTKVDKILDNVNKIELSNGKCFFLVNNAEPVNFIDNGIIGNFLELIWAEILQILTIITISKFSGLHELSENDRKVIASYWLESYSKVNRY